MCQKRTRPCSPGAARAPRHLLLLARRSAPGQTPAALGATRTRQVCSAQPQSWFCLLNLKRRAGRSRRRAGGRRRPRAACVRGSESAHRDSPSEGRPPTPAWLDGASVPPRALTSCSPSSAGGSGATCRPCSLSSRRSWGRATGCAPEGDSGSQPGHTASGGSCADRWASRAQYKCPGPIGAHAASKDTRPHVGPPRPRRGTRVPPDARTGTETRVAGRASPVMLQRRQARRLRQGGAPRETGEITADSPRLGPRGGPASPVRPCCRCATGHSAGARPCPWWS